MIASWFRRGFLWCVSRGLNPLTSRAARSGRGPFSLVRHVGRRSGRVRETPVILARTADGFVVELTYGPKVDWYRNIVAAGGCTVVHRGVEHAVDRIESCPREDGLRAFGFPKSLVLRILRRREFRHLHEQRS